MKRAGERPESERIRLLTRQPKGPLRNIQGSPKAPGPALSGIGGVRAAVRIAAFLAAWLPCHAGAGERIFDWEFVPLGEGGRSTAVIFTSSLCGFAGFEDGSLFLTRDGGSSWTEAAKLGQGILRIASRGLLVAAAGPGGAAVSTDGGKTFKLGNVPAAGSISDVAVDDRGCVWICATGGPILSSCDQGGSWKAMSPAWPGPLFAVACTGGGRVLAGGIAGLWERSSASAGWVRLPETAFCRFVFMARDSKGGAWPLASCGETAALYGDGGKGRKLRLIHDEPEVVMRGADAGEYGMWLWTGGRIALHSRNGRNWKRVPLPAPLDFIKGAAQNAAGTVWMAGARGGLYLGRAKGGPGNG